MGLEFEPQDSGLCSLLQLERKLAELSYFAESSSDKKRNLVFFKSVAESPFSGMN